MEEIDREFTMYQKVRNYMMKNQMTEPEDVILAGVSGGGDSMTMLSLLREFQEELNVTLCAVHVHHGIRGAEADRDRLLVEETCAEWQIPCSVYNYDVPELAAGWKLGYEETGRLVRKEAFEKESLKFSGKRIRIALAHNKEDLAETMLHNLSRGTGLRGLSAMRPVMGEIIRPVLCLEREEIAHYLKEQAIPHILDSSNLSDDYTRNRIRHHILPLMKQEINEQAVAHMAEAAGRLALAQDYLSEQGEKLLCRFTVPEKGYLFTHDFFENPRILQIYAIQKAMENLAGRRKDLSSVHVENLLELKKMQTGRQISLPYGMAAWKTYDGVRLMCGKPHKKENKVNGEWEIPCPGTLDCPSGFVQAKIFPYEGQKIEEKKCTKWLDYDMISNNPCIRTRKQGDYLTIDSAGNTKKLNRLMIDEKIPSEMRDQIPVIACGHEVLWIVGYRINARYRITPDTRQVLELKYQGGYLNERENQSFTQ